MPPALRDSYRTDSAAEAVANDIQEFYVAVDERKFGIPEKDDDGETEIVNAERLKRKCDTFYRQKVLNDALARNRTEG
ncbi:hypothetical protein IMZ48_08505 [Candidatus Bathyarchaeota archaeon]|nr:hypothetical protein [Candidatus Bathyarchaeota archaeon]